MNTSEEIKAIQHELFWSAYLMRRENTAAVDAYFAGKRLELLKERAILFKMEAKK